MICRGLLCFLLDIARLGASLAAGRAAGGWRRAGSRPLACPPAPPALPGRGRKRHSGAAAAAAAAGFSQWGARDGSNARNVPRGRGLPPPRPLIGRRPSLRATPTGWRSAARRGAGLCVCAGRGGGGEESGSGFGASRRGAASVLWGPALVF